MVFPFFEDRGKKERREMGSALSNYSGDAETAGSESQPERSRVKPFQSSSEWQLFFNENKDSNKLVVIDFSASWCGPSKFIEPAVNAMSAKFTDVLFVKIDVDELKDVAEKYGVQAIPTFVLLKNGNEVDRVIGAKKNELENKVKKHGEASRLPG